MNLKGYVLSLICIFQILFLFAQQDGNPPVVTSITVSPQTVNNGDSVTVTIDITDDISGVNGVGFPNLNYNLAQTQARIKNPVGGQSTDVIKWVNISGSIYAGKAKISNYAINGTWLVDYVSASDRAGNNAIYGGAQFNAYFQVTSSTPDTSAPILNSVIVSPDTAHNGDSITVTINAIDNVAGLGQKTARITNQNNSQIADVNQWTSLGNGTYTGKTKISDYAVNGTWKVNYVFLNDFAGNYKYYTNAVNYNANFLVISSSPDDTPPLLNQVYASPDSVLAGDSVQIFLDIQDTVSGVNGYGFPGGYNGHGSPTQVLFSNPDNSQIGFITNWNWVSGTLYKGKAKITNYAVNGVWKIKTIYSSDHANNGKTYYSGTDFNETFIVYGSMAANNVDFNETCTLFPNPVRNTNFFTVNGREITQINIFDLMGNSMYKKEYPNSTEVKVPLQNTFKGIYIVQIKTRDKLFYKKIFIE